MIRTSLESFRQLTSSEARIIGIIRILLFIDYPYFLILNEAKGILKFSISITSHALTFIQETEKIF